MILALDPSVGTGTGYVIYDIDKGIVDCGCIKFSSDQKNKTRKKIDLQHQYTHFIDRLISQNDIRSVYSEFPHGSQNANASWSMSMVTSIITAVCKSRRINVQYCLEGHWKKYIHGRAKKVSKIQTQKRVKNFFDVPELKYKYVIEGVSDALGVLKFLLDKNK